MHPSHITRFSWDASTYDEICINCDATDEVPGGWGQLAYPCSCPEEKRITLDEYYKQRNQSN